MAELQKLHLHPSPDRSWHVGHDQEFLQQLSTLDFVAKQKASYSKRHATTGQWLLESSNFNAWLNSEDHQHSVLWYRGNPGVGKTVLVSIAINHLTENAHLDGGTNAIIYIYCDYANAMTHSVENLLGSIVRQLVEQTTHGESIAEIKKFLRNAAKNRNMTKDDFSSWIEILSQKFDATYTFVDALDEFPGELRNKLLAQLQRLNYGNMRIFLTSRSNVDVMGQIPHVVQIDYKAVKHDISTFVESKIQESSRLALFTKEDSEMKQHIIDTVCDQANGMFLLASLQVLSLSHQTSISGVRSALQELPKDLFAMYDQFIERIRSQQEGDADLGMRVLLMIYGASRPLLVDELRHALAVRPNDTVLDLDSLVPLDILLNATAGLVSKDNETAFGLMMMLVHRTLEEYFEAHHQRLFPNKDVVMARVCISYLCLDEFGSGPCDGDGLFDKRERDFKFLSYASINWADHFRKVQMEVMDQSVAFIRDSMKTSSWLQVLDYSYFRGDVIRERDLLLDPSFLAAHFYLPELFTRLTAGRDINARNSIGETLLHRAVERRLWYGQPNLLFSVEQKRIRWDVRFRSPVGHSLDEDQLATVQAILDFGVDIDAKNPLGWTALFCAIRWNRERIAKLLIDRGANIFACNNYGESPIHIAAYMLVPMSFLELILEGSIHALAKLEHEGTLADTEAIPNSQGRLNTSTKPIHGKDVDDAEIRKQIVNIRDIAGRTPLHHVYYLFGVGSLNNSTNVLVRSTDMLQKLIKEGASETVTDVDGKIPKGYSTFSGPVKDNICSIAQTENDLAPEEFIFNIISLWE